MATDLGKVGIVAKGGWSNSVAYEVLDAVTYNDGFYIARQAVPAGTLPTNTTYWQKAVSNVMRRYSLGSNDQTTITVYNGAVIVFGRAAANKKGLAFIDSVGAVLEIISEPGVTFSKNGNNLTINNTLNVGIGLTVLNNDL